MSETLTGTVTRVTSKEQGQYGNLAYNLCIDCDDNNDKPEWFSAGWEAPACEVGDKIECSVKQNGKFWNIIKNSIQVTEPGNKGGDSGRGVQQSSRGSNRGDSSQQSSRGSNAQASRSSSQGAATSTGSMSKEQYWEQRAENDKARDLIIQLQSAQNTAIATIVGAIGAGAVALPTKKSDKYDAYIALIDEEVIRIRKNYLAGGPVVAQKQEEQENLPFDDDIPEFADDGPVPE